MHWTNHCRKLLYKVLLMCSYTQCDRVHPALLFIIVAGGVGKRSGQSQGTSRRMNRRPLQDRAQRAMNDRYRLISARICDMKLHVLRH
jgi:hypothetical protein